MNERDGSSGRRRLWLAWIVLVAVVVGVGGFAATRSKLLDVDEVQVLLTGNGPLTAAEVAEVAEVAGVFPGTPMVTVDLDALAARVQCKRTLTRDPKRDLAAKQIIHQPTFEIRRFI